MATCNPGSGFRGLSALVVDGRHFCVVPRRFALVIFSAARLEEPLSGNRLKRYFTSVESYCRLPNPLIPPQVTRKSSIDLFVKPLVSVELPGSRSQWLFGPG